MLRKIYRELVRIRKDMELLRSQLELLAKMSQGSIFDCGEIASVTNSMNEIYKTLEKSDLALAIGIFVCAHSLVCIFIQVEKLFRGSV